MRLIIHNIEIYTQDTNWKARLFLMFNKIEKLNSDIHKVI